MKKALSLALLVLSALIFTGCGGGSTSDDSGTLKKTGQTISYDRNGDENLSVKDDGYYRTGVTPHYTRDNIKEVVTDHITGLQWQDDEAAKTEYLDWENAIKHCEAPDLDGIGWRLPSKAELVNIVVYSDRVAPSLDPAFKNVVSNYYWSSTTYAGDNNNSAWDVYVGGGNHYGSTKSNSHFVRCVRAEQ